MPTWFSYVFTYTGGNKAKAGFFDAIVLVLETGFAVTAFIAVILNLVLAEEDEAEETESLAGDEEPEDLSNGAYHKDGLDESTKPVTESGDIGESIKA